MQVATPDALRGAARGRGRIGVVVKGYPRLSETFISQELHALEAQGFRLALFSLRQPTDARVHPIHAQIRASVAYLPEYLHEAPLRVLRAWRSMRASQNYVRARAAFVADVRRDATRNRVRRFGQAMVLAAELPADVVHLHAHFLHTPASVARYASLLTGRPFSISAHAKDIWTTPDWDKREKLAACAWTTTCTRTGADHLRAVSTSATVDLVYHGIDTTRFPLPPARSNIDGVITVLSVGRAVDKKGFDDLLVALARMKPRRGWRFEHVGGGPDLPKLERLAHELGIDARCTWRGALAQGDVLDAYRRADVFALASRVSGDGDRDGLPNVLLEAQSQKLACVATRVGGIAELIEDEATGLLAPERDPIAFAKALERVIDDDALRARLARAGYERTTGRFAMAAGIDQLTRRFDESLGTAAQSAELVEAPA
ncbi:MAG TPA: glycosyltransferase family 4 protein [Casimicrobiaceae bacterium]|nr:glycosyltransferase family 4 protein [Casimicrobiaceae bacterium]